MEIVEYFAADAPVRQILLRGLRQCGWGAGKFLLRLLEEGIFAATLGGPGKLFFLLDGEAVVSFLTLTAQDCIAAPELTPWIGFVFTFPEYRGHRYAGRLLDHARQCAAAAGAPFVFLATDHAGLYEKYGFSYWGTRMDVHGEASLIYTAPAADIELVAERAQARAQEVVRKSGVCAAWEAAGAVVRPVGSLATGLLMKHRDIDFHLCTATLDPAVGFAVMAKLCADPHFRQLEYRSLAETDEACLEWHAAYELDGEAWQIDMIQILKGSRFDGYFEHVAERIRAVLTPETRRAILSLKYLTPEDEHVMGIEYYRAVIADGVRTFGEFAEWRRAHPEPGLDLWCP